MANIAEIFARSLQESTVTIQSLGKLEPFMAAAADFVAECLRAGNKLLACGNGGSAADAADFCTEFACRFVQDRRPYPAMNLSQGGSLLTATGNDYGFDEIFARQIAAFGQSGDLVIVISTSGNSQNIRRALEEAKSRKLDSIALLGREGGKSKGIAKVDLIVKSDSTDRIQEGHKFLLHVLCEICEGDLATQ